MPADSASMAEDFIDIFAAPAKVFTRRAKASPMVPFLVVWIVMSVIFFASKSTMQPIIDATMAQQNAATMKANPQVTQAQIDKMKPIANVFINIAGVVGTPILLVIFALFIWIVGRFVMGGVFEFGTAVLIAAYSFLPKILASIIGIVQATMMDTSKLTSPYQLSISAARFFDPASMTTGLYGLLGQIDPFSVWSAFLVGVGVMYAGKVDKSKAMITAVIMFVLVCVPSLIAVALGK
ncbi:MAG TPA: YIP1 family protein [Gemmatimonadaceae bacterium]|jgi:hypothetical protein